ncbi:MAG: TDP-N-acetylfucosamine:lipid II N-acetylfucosaminyltransferase [Idiomarina sp.]
MKKLLHVFFEAHHHNQPIYDLFKRFEQYGEIRSHYAYFDRKSFFPEQKFVPDKEAFYFSANKDFLPWLRASCQNYDMVVFHGMFNATLWSFLAEEAEISARSAWVVFGGEIYEGLDNVTPERLQLMRQASMALKYVLTFTTAEATIVRDQLQRSEPIGRYVYIQNWHPEELTEKPDTAVLPAELARLCSEPDMALLGNSGTPANHHVEVLSALAKSEFRGSILIPLAYGASEAYQSEVTEHARSLFPAERLYFLTEPLASDTYRYVLNQVNYFLLPHFRQQAGQHWLAALATGIPIFGEPQGANHQRFENLGFQVGDVFAPNFDTHYLASFAANRKLYREHFNIDKIYNLWLQNLGLLNY